MKLFAAFCVLVVAVAAEAPFSGYAPSGWRPQGAQLRLPNEYGAPVIQPRKQVQVEISKERIAHAAQIVEQSITEQPANEYLPPTTTEQEPDLDPIRVQGLPDNQFKDFQRVNQQQTAKVNTDRRANPAPQQQQPFFPLSGQLRALPANFQFGRQIQAQPQPAQTYGVPDQDDTDQETEEQPEDAIQTTPQPDADDDEDDQNTDGRTVLAVANSFSGQYYILGTDNTLQRVTYATSQSDDDIRKMGFTAQLRYAPVEPITGPVYAYNEEGQLVRIYK